MTRRTLLAAVLMLVFAAPPFVRAQTAAGDPLSGHWGSDGITLLELKYDGKKTVSGTTIWRGRQDEGRRIPIDKGTFDPKTGAMKIEGDGPGPDDAPAHFVIEGKLDKETLSGSYLFGPGKGDFSFKKIAQAQK